MQIFERIQEELEEELEDLKQVAIDTVVHMAERQTEDFITRINQILERAKLGERP